MSSSTPSTGEALSPRLCPTLQESIQEQGAGTPPLGLQDIAPFHCKAAGYINQNIYIVLNMYLNYVCVALITLY